MNHWKPWTHLSKVIEVRQRRARRDLSVRRDGIMSRSTKLTVEVWYDPETSNVIQLSSEDARLTDEDGHRKGIMIGVNLNRQPKTFARLDALLRSEGISRP